MPGLNKLISGQNVNCSTCSTVSIISISQVFLLKKCE